MSNVKFFLLGFLFFLGACDDGTRLSPIDIYNVEKDSDLKPIYADYYAVENFVIDNNGKYLSVYVSGSVLVVSSEKDYLGQELPLEKFVIKSPSEHKVNDEHFPLELQFHHTDSLGKPIIASVFVVEGEESPDLQLIIDNIPPKGSPQKIETPIDLYYLFSMGQNYWTYEGSYTDKPYEASVTWYIMQDPIEASAQQIEAIVNAIGKNKKEVVEIGDIKIRGF
ncbi:MAG: carbonic anhydrase family protein [Bacteroidales bacterium]|nr:carbonic anhydrase family protein [Bacteroidales bacterium]